jgi:DNA-binding PadR family transcriptional regulator
MWDMYRKIRRIGGLRYITLQMLRDAPKNGAEIMEESEKMSMGWWRPSPGSIYPLLNSLTEEGLIQKRGDGRYELTPKGKEEIEDLGWMANQKKSTTVEGILADIDNYLSFLEDTPKEKIMPHIGKIKEISERLQKLGESKI